MKLYVFCHNAITKPSGGVMVLFKIAEGLIKAGYDTKILVPGELYPEENPSVYKPSWFDTDVPTTNKMDDITSDDVVLIHEEAVWAFSYIKKNNPRHIMINQGAQCTLCIEHLDYNTVKNMYQTALGIVTVSNYISDTLNTIFDIPYEKLYTINNINIISKAFNPGLKTNKILIQQKWTSKNNIANKMLLKIIEQKYRSDWKVEYINDRPNIEMARVMNESKIFVFLCHDWGEGFGIPPVEAALSGCKIIGYSGLGGRHFYKEPLFTEIEYNDINSFIKELNYWTTHLKNKSILSYSDGAIIEYDKLLKQRDENIFFKKIKEIVNKILG